MKKILFSFVVLCGIAFAQNDIDVTQNSGLDSKAYVFQRGNNNNFYSSQEAIGGTNNLDSYQEIPSVQNDIYIIQNAGISNDADLRQYAGTQNYMHISQEALQQNSVYSNQEYGEHWLKLETTSQLGSNTAYINQLNGSGYANIKQTAMFDNIIPDAASIQNNTLGGLPGIYQNGNENYIVGSSPSLSPLIPVEVQPDLPAVQNSIQGSNLMQILQIGDNNVVGLTQEAGFNNSTFINQQNDNNKLAVYQTNVLGSNSLYVEQMGNMQAIVYQKAMSGLSNKAIIIQK